MKRTPSGESFSEDRIRHQTDLTGPDRIGFRHRVCLILTFQRPTLSAQALMLQPLAPLSTATRAMTYLLRLHGGTLCTDFGCRHASHSGSSGGCIQLECSTFENPPRGREFARICLSCRSPVEFPTRPTMVFTYIYILASHARLALHRPPPSYVCQAHESTQTKWFFNTYRC